MGRLIDAEELKEIIGCGNAVKYGNADREQQDVSYSTMMMYEINDAIDAAPTVGEWISDKENLPKSGQRYLTVGARGVMRVAKAYVPAQVMPNWGGAADYHWWECEGKRCSVTHYMQLPAEPEGSSQ